MPRLLLVLSLAMVAAACTPTGGTDDQVTLRVMMADDWADTRIVIDVVRRFEESHPGVEVALIPRPFSQILDDLHTDVAAGDPPDVVHQHVYAAAAQGLAEPLDDLWGPDGQLQREDFFPGAITDVSWGEGIYGVPLDINAMFMVLDADIADDIGIPQTFADVRAFAEEAVDRGSRGLAIPASTWVTYGWVRANGGEYMELDDDGNPTFLFDSPEVVETLEFLGALVADELAYGPTARGVGADAYELFRWGDTAMLTTGTYAVAQLEAESDRAFVSAPMPGGVTGTTEGTTLGGSSLLVGRGSAHRELAIEFILALTSPPLDIALAEEEGRMPARMAAYDTPGFAAPALDTLSQQLPSARPMLMEAFPAANEALSTAIDEILTGRADAATSLRRAQQVAEASVPS